jgi:DNA-binding NarL/FixJ family response regulator
LIATFIGGMALNMKQADPPMSPNRIIIADDHPVFREGLRRVLAEISPDAEVQEAGDYDTVVALAGAGPDPAMFLLDLGFPGMVLAQAIPQLRRKYPRTSIIIISMADDRGSIDRVMAAGVDGFISKAVDHEAMKAAIIAVQQGDFVTVAGPQGLSSDGGIGLQFPAMTGRQTEVLRHVAQGKSNKEIARDLKISPLTVRLHVSGLLSAMGVESRTAAAALAVKYGI